MQTITYTGINNKVPLHSTGNYIQYPETNHSGKEYKKEYIHIYVCITESLYCTAEINIVNQLYFNLKKKKKHRDSNKNCLVQGLIKR